MSFEKRVYDAIYKGRGIRLSLDELRSFVLCDDALLVRITNAANADRGEEESGNFDSQFGNVPWSKLGVWK